MFQPRQVEQRERVDQLKDKAAVFPGEIRVFPDKAALLQLVQAFGQLFAVRHVFDRLQLRPRQSAPFGRQGFNDGQMISRFFEQGRIKLGVLVAERAVLLEKELVNIL